ncbi:hypothetical protein ACIGCK_08045 [Microbacterium sp. NPDC078428]|uniref:hypothetical protein n=1 Tax=Microbacterium sp. NPDC078428 TaxID=3364190 RepID=UPI0037CC9AE7
MDSSTPDTADLLDAGWRAVRRVAPPEAPFPAVLARLGDECAHLVDARALDGWRGWDARGEHVLRPIDVVRRRDGHDVVLPWCVETVHGFLDRRERAGVPLAAGEQVTLAVGLLRGHRAAAAHGGRWWLTIDGCPVVVPVLPSQAPEEAGTPRLLERIADGAGTAAARSLRTVASALDSSSPTELEGVLFALADGEALRLDPAVPRRVHALDAVIARPEHPADGAEPSPGVVRGILRRYVDRGLGDAVGSAFDDTRTALTRLGRALRRPWLAAAAVAGVIVVGGLAWPAAAGPEPGTAHSGDDPTAAASAAAAPDVGAGTGADADADRAPADPASPGAGDAGGEVVRTTSHLLETRLSCLRGGACAVYAEAPALLPSDGGAADLAEDDRELTLLDDLGGVAVLRVDPSDRGSDRPGALIVVVRTTQGWLLRDIRAVEPPP